MPGSEVKGVNESLCIIIREGAALICGRTGKSSVALMAFLKQSGIVSHICRCLNLYLNPTLKSRMLSTLLKKYLRI